MPEIITEEKVDTYTTVFSDVLSIYISKVVIIVAATERGLLVWNEKELRKTQIHNNS